MSNTCDTLRPGFRIRSWLGAGRDWFIPVRIREGDPDVLRRARLVVAFGATLITLAMIYAALILRMNSPISAAALVAAAGVVVAGLWVVRATGWFFAVGNLTTAAFCGALTVLACRLGGHGSIVLPWYSAVPVVALITAGRRSAAFWFAATVSLLAAFYGADRAGYAFPNDLTPSDYDLLCLLGWSGLTALVLTLALLYEAAKVQMLSRLEQHSRFLSTVVESLAHPFLVIDADDHSIRLANTAALKNGAPGATTCHALTHRRDTPCDGSDDPCPLDVVRQTRSPVVAEHTHSTPDGVPRVVEVHAHPVFDEADRLVQVIEYSLDITERKKSEATLRKAKKHADAHARHAEETLAEMARINAAMIGREERVMEMKQEVNELLAQLGRAHKYEHV